MSFIGNPVFNLVLCLNPAFNPCCLQVMNGEHIGTLIHRDANKWDHSHHHSDGSGKARDAAVAARTASRKLQVSTCKWLVLFLLLCKEGGC
jgi:hypothetical protein